MHQEIILTGIRSNGDLTLGNYLGAILPMVQLQKQKAGQYQLNFFVPDLHSFTTPVKHSTLYENTINNLHVFAAAGLDFSNRNTFVYRQSYIPAHSELFTILNNFVYFGELSRMTQFKDKSTGEENITSGLFTYPVLMAADILLYGARYVPVGEDQRQHLELARDLAIRFNNKFGETFVVPLAWKDQLSFYNRDNGIRIRSLRNPEKKMSKSIDDPAGTILLTDTPAEAIKKVMSATTDSLGNIQFDFTERPGVSNLLQILALLTDRSQHSVNAEWIGQANYGALKEAVAAELDKFMTDYQMRYQNVDMSKIYNKLVESESSLRETTRNILLKVQEKVGLRSSWPIKDICRLCYYSRFSIDYLSDYGLINMVEYAQQLKDVSAHLSHDGEIVVFENIGVKYVAISDVVVGNKDWALNILKHYFSENTNYTLIKNIRYESKGYSNEVSKEYFSPTLNGYLIQID